MRYAAIPWPWVGLFLVLALVTQELLARWFGNAPAMAEAFYRVGIMAIGVACIALILLPPRRVAYLLGFLVCAGLIGWALWLQYGEGLEPCPLCMFQRVAVIAVGVVFLIAAIHDPGRAGAALYAVLTLLLAGAGAAFAARQIWLQALPKDQVPACGMGLDYMMSTLPFTDVIRRVLEGSGECAEKAWVFLGLSHPLDLVRWYLGPIREVQATASRSAMGGKYGLKGNDIYIINAVAESGQIGRAMGHYGVHELPTARNCIELMLYGSEGSSLAQYHDMKYVHTAPAKRADHPAEHKVEEVHAGFRAGELEERCRPVHGDDGLVIELPTP